MSSSIDTRLLLAGVLLGAAGLVNPLLPDAAADTALSDPEIAAIVVAANSVDIEAGEAAVSKASDAEVKEFADRMVTDHKAVNKSAVDLVTKLGVTPKESATSKKLQSDGEATMQKLAQLKGADFDKAYVENEVAYHEAVIGVLDKDLIPSAKNAELKALLQKSRPAFVAHLEHAKKIRAELQQ